MTILEFVQKFKENKVANSKIAPNAIEDFIRENVKITKYIPFRLKRTLAETVVEENIEEVDGVKKCDDIELYVSFIVASITAHTDLGFSDDPVADYDLLAESGLLSLIIDMFHEDHTECDVILKMALAAELQDNNINIQIAKFLNRILNKLDDVGEVLKDKLENFDVNKMTNGMFKQEDLVKLSSFLDRYNK